MGEKINTGRWWGEYSFDDNNVVRWSFPELDVTVRCQAKEWNVWHEYKSENAGDNLGFFLEKTKGTDLLSSDYQRYLYTENSGTLEIMPKLPDRNLVTKPINPLILRPRQKTSLFVGTPVWFSIREKKEKNPFFEVPLRKLSDTWFGPSSVKGEVCYASKTHAVTSPEGLKHKSFRAIVPITIENKSQSESIKFEKINVPVTLLTLYCDENDRFWSSPIYLAKDDGSTEIQIKLDSLAQAESYTGSRVVKLAEPRRREDHPLILRAYDMLFS